MAKTTDELENQEQLEDFTWDSTESATSLFEEETEEVLTKEEKEELKGKKKNEKSTKKDDAGSSGSTATGDSEEGSEEGSSQESDSEEHLEQEPFSKEESKPEEGKDEKEFFKTLAVELKQAGVFSNIEIDNSEEIDQERFIELQDAEVEARVDETFKSFFEELDEDAKRFLKFKKEGGDTRKFFETLRRDTERPEGDLEDKKHQERLIRHYYANYEGMGIDEIDDRIEWLQSTGKMKKYAEGYNSKMKQLEQQQQQALIEQEKARRDERENEKTEFINGVTETLSKLEEVNNIPFTKKDKAELVGYLTKPAVKIGQNKYITQFQADMKQLTGKHQTLLLLAKLVKNNFDLSDLQRKQETKQTLKLRDKLDSTQKTITTRSSGSSNNKSLADYFN